GEQPAAVLERPAGGHHRLQYERRGTGQVGRQRLEVRAGQERLLVAGEADEPPRPLGPKGERGRGRGDGRTQHRDQQRPGGGARTGVPTGVSTGNSSTGNERAASYTSIVVSSCSAARNEPLSVRASRMAVRRDLASGWSTTSMSTDAQPSGAHGARKLASMT